MPRAERQGIRLCFSEPEQARRMALFATPASVFDDQTHCGYLGDAFSTLRYPKLSACKREKYFNHPDYVD